MVLCVNKTRVKAEKVFLIEGANADEVKSNIELTPLKFEKNSNLKGQVYN
jgi:hypothetical protein